MRPGRGAPAPARSVPHQKDCARPRGPGSRHARPFPARSQGASLSGPPLSKRARRRPPASPGVSPPRGAAADAPPKETTPLGRPAPQHKAMLRGYQPRARPLGIGSHPTVPVRPLVAMRAMHLLRGEVAGAAPRRAARRTHPRDSPPTRAAPLPSLARAGPGPPTHAPPQTGFSRPPGGTPRPGRPAHDSTATDTSARPTSRHSGAGHGSPPASHGTRNTRAPSPEQARGAACETGFRTGFIPRPPTIARILRFPEGKSAKHFLANRPQSLISLSRETARNRWRPTRTPP